ncbi:diguanylate cyclase [Vibrio sp. RC27]
MESSNATYFFESVLNSLPEQLAVIDGEGRIVFVNQSWINFSSLNGGGTIEWTNVNYLECCTSSQVDSDFTKVAKGIKAIITTNEGTFTYEYPCHSPTEQRWFIMRMSPLNWEGSPYFVVTHQDITQRKLAEQKAEALALEDALTGIANRRKFTEFSDEQWRFNMREKTPLAVAIIDIDYFKSLNDTYGHAFGDECLVKLGAILKEMVRRPNELCARLGGDEFIIIFGNTTLLQARQRTEQILSCINAISLNHNSDFDYSFALKVSIGCASLVPTQETSLENLINKADINLYRAKQSGRNKFVS